MRALWNGIFLGLLSLFFLAGCGGGQSTSSNSGSDGNVSGNSTEASSTSDSLTASISGPGATESGEVEPAGPEEGTAEWSLVEIIKLRRTPISTDKTAEEVTRIRAERNHQIVEHALKAIGLLIGDPAKEELFTEAVRQLMEAQLDLALVDPEKVDELYENCDVICKQVPKSKAAAEASFAVARFAHTRARDFAQKEPRWLDEFARQAQSFAQGFPQEEAKAVSLLYAAGSSCELHSKREEALACYNLLRELFPKSPQAQQIVAVLRRLQLEGKSVELSGETLSGEVLSIDNFAGNPVVVVFWSTDNPQSLRMLPQLVETVQKHEHAGVKLIGVNLDDDESTVKAFLSDKPWDWPQLFDSNTAKRRWKHDVVKYYGVRSIPLVWLIDAEGKVVNAQVNVDELDQQIGSLAGETKPTKRRKK